MEQLCKKLNVASRLHPTILRALAAPSFGWTNKTILLETLLTELANKWEDFELPGRSIYEPNAEKGAEQRLDEYDGNRRMQEHLVYILSCDNDGWVSNDRWDEVLERYRLEYRRWVLSVMESEEAKTDEEKAAALALANRIWPWDQR